MRRTPWLICCAVIGYVSAGRRPTYPQATPTEMAPPFTPANGLYAQRKWSYRDTFSLRLVPDKQSRWDLNNGLWIVHLNMPSFAQSHAVPDPVSSVEHIYFEECWKPNSFGSHWLALFFVQSTKTVWFPTFFKISSFMFTRRRKVIQGWNAVRMSKAWQILNFEWTIPFSRLEETETNKLSFVFSVILHNLQYK